MRAAFGPASMAGAPAGSGAAGLAASAISRSSQSTPVTLEQKSRRRPGSSRRNRAKSAAWDAPRRSECWAPGPGFATTATGAPGKRARSRSRICSAVSMSEGGLGPLLADENGGLPDRGILRGPQVVLAELRHRVVARRPGLQVARRIRAGDGLAPDLLLQLHEPVEQRLRPRRAARDVDVDRHEAVDPLEDIVALLEGPAGDGAGAHRDAVLGLRHLVPEANDRGGHLLRHRARDDEQVGLPRRRAEDLGAKAGDVEARHGGRDHLDRAARQPDLQGAYRVASAPVVELLHARQQDAVAAQLLALGIRRDGGRWRGVAHVISTRGAPGAMPRRAPQRAAG